MTINETINLRKSLLYKGKDTIKIDEYFQNFIQTNERFSFECIFKLVEMDKHACSVHFVPTSVAYKHFGECICITKIICTDKERQNNIRSVSNGVNTFGKIKANSNDTMLDKERNYLANVGFSVKDIFEIEHL